MGACINYRTISCLTEGSDDLWITVGIAFCRYDRDHRHSRNKATATDPEFADLALPCQQLLVGFGHKRSVNPLGAQSRSHVGKVQRHELELVLRDARPSGAVPDGHLTESVERHHGNCLAGEILRALYLAGLEHN